MRWFLTEANTLIPERSIVKIAPGGPLGKAMAYAVDRRGVMETVTLAETFEHYAETMGSDQAPQPSPQPPAGARATEKTARN